MVARGDLGVEMRPEQVPVVQKRIILEARNALVPVITATQMLDSMQKNPRPARARHPMWPTQFLTAATL